MAAKSRRFDELCDSTYHYCVCRDKLRAMVLDLEGKLAMCEAALDKASKMIARYERQLQASNDERLKLERSLEQVRSLVIDALD